MSHYIYAAWTSLTPPAVGLLVQHLLVLFLAVGMPLWDWYEIPRLKASTEPRKKIRYYKKIAAALWVCALIAASTIGIRTAFTIQKPAGELAWLEAGSWQEKLLIGILAGMMVAILLPAVLAVWNQKIRAKAGRAAKRLAYLLPSTGEERKWWWLVCITAGVCEEIVYRGFLLHYFSVMPLHFRLIWALVVASVIFGVGHLYQGALGAIQTAIIGSVFACLFVMTGSLLVPMIVHAVLDLRVLAMLPEGFDVAQ